MATCDVCGNAYRNSFTVTQGAVTGTFDSFECAIHAMAPVARTASARLSATALSATGWCTAASTAHAMRGGEAMTGTQTRAEA